MFCCWFWIDSSDVTNNVTMTWCNKHIHTASDFGVASHRTLVQTIGLWHDHRTLAWPLDFGVLHTYWSKPTGWDRSVNSLPVHELVVSNWFSPLPHELTHYLIVSWWLPTDSAPPQRWLQEEQAASVGMHVILYGSRPQVSTNTCRIYWQHLDYNINVMAGHIY